jgi:hypothetical protein
MTSGRYGAAHSLKPLMRQLASPEVNIASTRMHCGATQVSFLVLIVANFMPSPEHPWLTPMPRAGQGAENADKFPTTAHTTTMTSTSTESKVEISSSSC